MATTRGAPPLTPAETLRQLESLRARTVRLLAGGVALGATGYIAAATVGALAGRDLGGSEAWSGVPTAAAVLGTAFGAAALSWVSARHGRRRALVLGYLLGAVAGVGAVAALQVRSFPLLLIAMFVLGWPNAASQISRYAGGDLYIQARRARAVGTVVWGATIGAVVGPNLVGPMGQVAEASGWDPLAGAFVVGICAFGIAGVLGHLLLRPDPSEIAESPAPHPDDGRVGSVSVRGLLARPAISAALTALVAGQVVMVMVMTMTPLHLREHGHGLEVVGLVLSAHTLGMFALAPISGRLTDRFGPLPTITTGFAILAAACVLAFVAPSGGGPILVVALFLLGFGWNLGFVAGSSMVSGGLPLAIRARLQGTIDAVIWTSSAMASVASGALMGIIGFDGLAVLSALLTVVPAVVVIASVRRMPVPQRT
ncbi:MAG: MFS transporter [Chloroflexi bacterium]|nr:MFS transporter [Chloroflexota bacterium]